jgi:hypothetical protein
MPHDATTVAELPRWKQRLPVSSYDLISRRALAPGPAATVYQEPIYPHSTAGWLIELRDSAAKVVQKPLNHPREGGAFDPVFPATGLAPVV